MRHIGSCAIAIALTTAMVGSVGSAAIRPSDPPSAPAPSPAAVQTELPSRTVRVAVFVDAPFAMRESSGRWDGFAAVAMQGAAIPAHLVLDFRECSSLEQLFSDVESGTADIGIGNTLVTSDRLARVAFTQPILEGGLKVMVPSDHSHSLGRLWEGLVSDGHVRVMAFGALITLALSVAVALVLRRIDREFTPHMHEGLAESFYHVISVTMTGKTSYKGKAAPGWIGKIVAALWLVFGVATVAYLTSSLSSVMTANTLHARINGPLDLHGRRIGTLKGGVGERYCAQHGLHTASFDSVDAAADALVAHEIDAVVADALSLEYFDTSHPGIAVTTVGGIFEQRHYAFAVRPDDDDLLRRLNVAILQLREDGALDRLRSRWFGR